jgi:hypothetical protein
MAISDLYHTRRKQHKGLIIVKCTSVLFFLGVSNGYEGIPSKGLIFLYT